MFEQITIHDRTFRKYIDADQIRQRVQAMGEELHSRYTNLRPLFLCVLNGAFVFAADLIRAFGAPCEVSFIKLASYRGTTSTGQVATLIGLDVDICQRHVIIVEDIVDTGKTLHTLQADLAQLQPASITIATLLLKPDMLAHPLQAHYVGFRIPPYFVVGYGLDYDGLGRELADIYQLVSV